MDELKDWTTEAIEREAIPKPLRQDSVREFCKSFGINEKQYWYQMSKKENQEKTLQLSLNLAKRETPEVLVNLAERAKKDNKAAELFLDYILELSKNLDIKTAGLPLIQIAEEVAKKYALIAPITSNDSKG